MKTASSKLMNMLKHSSAVKALPEVIVEWNLNRYHDTRVDNVVEETDYAFDDELFPIESIVLPNRPHKGINKARVGQSTVTRGYEASSVIQDARFYIADPEDQYKYWTSPVPANGTTFPLFNTTNFPDSPSGSHDNKTAVRPYVEYGTWSRTVDSEGYTEQTNFTAGSVKANKIVIKFENTWASPNSFDIIITRPTGSVTVPGSSIPSGWEGPGEIVLYWSGTAWAAGTGPVADTVTGLPLTDTIRKIQLEVRTLKGGYQHTAPGEPLVPTTYKDSQGNTVTTNGSGSFFDLIEISARLEADVSMWVSEVSDDFEMSEVSNLYPIGTLTSNTGNVSLTNIYQLANGEWGVGLFSRENSDPRVPWSNYIERNAKFTLNYAFYDNEDSPVPFEKVRQFVMYADSWTGQADETVNIDLSDFSKFFNDITLAPAMWENLTVPQIIWRILDSVGFNEFEIDRGDLAVEHEIPVFYSTGEDSVWEVLDQLAKATQTAIYFDGNGVLKIKTREYAFKSTPATWTLQSFDDAAQKANIVSASQTEEFEPNSVKVIYQKTNWSEVKNGNPVMQFVWEPETATTVLRAAPLTRNMSASAKNFSIPPGDAKVWPYEGLVNIQGEIIRYDAKQWTYYTGPNGGQANSVWVTSEEDRVAAQRKATAGHGHKSHWTGRLRVARDEQNRPERGLWNTEEMAHSVDIDGWATRRIRNGTHALNAYGLKHIKNESRAELVTGPHFKTAADLLVATRGAPDDQPFFYYGTKMRFVRESGRSTQRAGIVIHNSGNSNNGENGYYIELTPTARISAAMRQKRGELAIYTRSGGKEKMLSTVAVSIAGGVDYDLDVAWINPSGAAEHVLQVRVNGKMYANVKVQGDDRITAGGRFGIFARGKTRARFEYVYAIRRPEAPRVDDFSFLDRVQRGYTGSQWDREWVYNWQEYRKQGTRRKKSRKAKRRKNRQFFDEFGPIVHEIREFDVKFDPNPILHSYAYLTNDWSTILLDYVANPFGAKFTIANTARHNAVVHGEDRTSFSGSGDSISQRLGVLGRPLVVAEAEEILAENVPQIRARGRTETELSSPWIQSKSMARDLANWIRKNFTYGNEGLEIEAFGNPLIEVGDVVKVNYPERHISGDYFVTRVSNQFERGIVTTIGLRKRI